MFFFSVLLIYSLCIVLMNLSRVFKYSISTFLLLLAILDKLSVLSVYDAFTCFAVLTFDIETDIFISHCCMLVKRVRIISLS